MPRQAARAELLRHRGTRFDASVVDTLLCALDLADDPAVERHTALAPVAQD
jgi:hypothetical protein